MGCWKQGICEFFDVDYNVVGGLLDSSGDVISEFRSWDSGSWATLAWGAYIWFVLGVAMISSIAIPIPEPKG